MLQLISETNKQEDGHKGSMRGRRQRSHTDVLKGDQLKNLHHYATTGEIQPLLLNANTSGQEQTQHFIQKLKLNHEIKTEYNSEVTDSEEQSKKNVFYSV